MDCKKILTAIIILGVIYTELALNGIEENRQTGFMSIEELKEFSGCP